MESFRAIVFCFVLMMPVAMPFEEQGGYCIIKGTDIHECDDPNTPKGVVTLLMFNTTCDANKVPAFTKGNTYEMKMRFKPLEDAENAKVVVMVSLGPFIIPVRDLVNSNACENHGLECPLKADTVYNYRAVFEIREMLPIRTKMTVKLMWYLVNESSSIQSGKVVKNQILCIQMSETIQPSSSETMAVYSGHQEDLPSFRVVN